MTDLNVTISTAPQIEVVTVPITIGGSVGGAGHTIEDEGIALTTRTNLNFVGSGVTVTDDSGNDASVVTIPTAAGALLAANNLTDLASLSTTWSNMGFGTFVNVHQWGAAASGGDDTAAIQLAIDSAPTGSTIYFPAGTYLVSATILLDEEKRYVGDMYQGGTVIKLKDSTNLATPILAAKGWYNNTGSSNGVEIHNIAIDGNKANNSSSTSDGIMLCNWQSAIRNVHVYNCKGSGIVLTDAKRNGTSIGASTVVENRIENCRVSTCDGRGIYVWEQSGSGKLTDGFCVDNIINSCALDAILIQRGAGWKIDGNHTYTGSGLGTMAIRVNNCFSTRITNNYVDNYGQSATTGFYSGIRAELGTASPSSGARGSVITGNTIACTEDTAGSTYRHLFVFSASSGICRVVVANNTITGGAQTNGTGIRIESQSGGTLDARVANNQAVNCNTPFTGVATGTLSGRFDLHGSGTPLSVVTAPIGATFTRSDGGTATTLYVKESGTDASGWVAVGAGGGGSGNVATDTIFDAKGDLAVGTGADTAAKLTVGANDTIPMADSAQTTGIKWGTPATVKTALSLNNVDNVADASKPVSTAQAAADAAVLAAAQPLDSDLTTIAGLTATTNNMIQSVGSAWASRTPTQVKAALAIAESDVTNLTTDLAAKQPLDTDLTTIAGLTATTDNFMVAVASAWASRTPAQVKTTLAIAESDVTNLVTDLAAKAPLASPTFTGSVTIVGGTITGITDLTVADGGTGVSTLTSHGVVIGQGTSAVAVTTSGASGEVLTSNGASADPSFGAVPDSPAVKVISRQSYK